MVLVFNGNKGSIPANHYDNPKNNCLHELDDDFIRLYFKPPPGVVKQLLNNNNSNLPSPITGTTYELR